MFSNVTHENVESIMSSTFEDLIRNDPEMRRRYEIISKVGEESERGMTVLIGAELDRSLELLLKAYLVPGKSRKDLFEGGTPPLGSFSAKINLARALHLIAEEEYELLHLIRRIRNEFAHNPDASFGDAQISSWMRTIPAQGRDEDPKSKFTLCAVQLIVAVEFDARHSAYGRVYEESYDTFHRRGWDRSKEPYQSADAVAADFKE